MMSNGKSHVHQDDTNYTTMGPNLTWTKKQTDIVMDALKYNGSAKSVTRALKDVNVFSKGKFPSASQINAKIAYYSACSIFGCLAFLEMNWSRDRV